MKWFVREYLNSEEEALNPLASPIFQADLSGLPATLFIQAENDPIADDAIVYALSLERAGVTVESDPGEGLIHCYFTLFNEFPNAISEATNKIIYFLKKQGYCS
jgi:acetyl esterase